MTNTTENKPSTIETIKEKATNLVHKVTGKSSNTHETDLHNNEALSQNPTVNHNTEHGQVNPSAFLSSVRTPHDNAAVDGITRPDAIQDQNHHTAAALGTTGLAGSQAGQHIPTHAHNAAVPASAIAPGTTHEHHHGLGHHNEQAGVGSEHHHDHHGKAIAGAVGAAAAAEAVHHHHKKEHEHELEGQHAHGHHGHAHGEVHSDPSQAGVTSRLVGGRGDVNNLEGMQMRPAM